MRKRFVVIGSGFGGLAVAVRLAARGYDVELFEKCDRLGGRAGQFEINGFKFDAGPTAITVPFLFDEIWKTAGKNREDYFQLVPVDPFFRAFDFQGRYIDFSGDQENLLSQIEQRSPGDRQGLEEYWRRSQRIFDKGFNQLSGRPFLKKVDMLMAAPDLLRLESYRSIYSYVSRLVKDDLLRRALTFHTLLAGGNPFDTSSIYSLSEILQREYGVWFALGGTAAIISALARLFEDLGGKIHLNSEVSEILLQNRRVTGVRLADGSVHHADMTISNADPAWTYRYLIPAKHRRVYTDRRIDRMRYSMSFFVLYFGTRRTYRDNTQLVHHNLLFTGRYRDLMDEVFNKKVLAPDFALTLHMPTYTDPSLAPEGGETFCVVSPVPHLDGQIDWTKSARPYRDAILKYLEENYLPDLRANIVAEHYIDPLFFQNTLNSYKGAAFSFQPLPNQSGWFRPHNQSEEFEDLYFSGAGTQPGGSVVGVLRSAQIVDDLIAAAG